MANHHFAFPKGWTGPKEVDGLKTENFWRSHQVPFSAVRENPEHLKLLEACLKSYKADELFDENGTFLPELKALAPEGKKRMSDSSHTNGGLLLKDLRLPEFTDYAIDVPAPGAVTAEAARVQGAFLRDVMKLNSDAQNFRLFGPDETVSNRWTHAFEVTARTWMEATIPEDDHLSAEGRVMEILSEHTCQGWL